MSVAEQTRQPEFTGPAVPGYRLIGPLARTVMSEVYTAEEISGARRRVALKIVHLAGARPDRVTRFREEIRIAERLRHPHIAETYHGGELPTCLFLAMQYIEGDDLGRVLLRQGRLETGRTIEIARQIADALDAAHAADLVHRDVKPGNILLEESTGAAFLCDFGIAKDLQQSQALTVDGPVLTPLYAAPEQHSVSRVDRRADVYGLAAVIYHCLTGSPPFDGSTREVLDAHREALFLPVSAASPELPAQIDEVFLRGLAKLPAHRYTSCSQLVEDLAAVLEGRPRPELPPLPPSSSLPPAAPATLGPEDVRALHRPGSAAKRRAVISGAVAIVAVTATVLGLHLGSQATPAKSPARASGTSTTGGTPSAKPPTRTSATIAAFPTDAERSLISLVGADGCRRASSSGTTEKTADKTTEGTTGGTASVAGVLAAVDCTPPGTGATGETYMLFDSVADLRQVFDQDAASAKAPNGVQCTEGKAPGFLGNQRYDIRSVDLGGLLCRPGPNSSLVMEWSVEPLRVLGTATGTDPKTLASWWRSYYGPPVSAIAAAVNKQSTPPFPTPQESDLLSHIPAASRANCMRPSEQQKKVNVGNAPVIGVVCGPTTGAAIVFYYRFADNAAMQASYGTPEMDGADCTTETTGFSGEHAYSRGHETGRLQCSTTDDTGERDMVWTDNRLSIEGFAFEGGDPAAMIDWWLNDAGPS